MDKIWDGAVDKNLYESMIRCASLNVILGTKLHAIRYNEEKRGGLDFEDG